MIRRRFFISTAGACLAPLPSVRAQQAGRQLRIGLLSNNPWTDPTTLVFWSAFEGALQGFGWSEGRTMTFERVSTDGVFARLPAVARDLVARDVDLIVVPGGLAAVALRDATKSIPVVFIGVSDPVAAGLVGNLARPGGNLTGLANMSLELVAKRIQLLLEVASQVRRMAILTTGTAGSVIEDEAGRIAAGLGLQSVPVKVEREAGLVSAVAGRRDVDAWMVADSILVFEREAVVSAFLGQQLPVIYPNSTFIRLGGLLSYGANPLAQARRAAWFVDRILRGARPGDLPVELPSEFELAVNTRTARQQGIVVAPSVLLRADAVFE